MFCGADKCEPKCPAYVGMSDNTNCQIINAMLETEKAKRKAYQAMESHWKDKNVK